MGALVSCNNVICSWSITKTHIKQFEENYKKYCDLIGELFNNVKVLPNHHYALHAPNQFCQMGPLICLLEFPGERLIGFLKKITTNNLIGKSAG
jgi:hypothetical protein